MSRSSSVSSQSSTERLHAQRGWNYGLAKSLRSDANRSRRRPHYAIETPPNSPEPSISSLSSFECLSCSSPTPSVVSFPSIPTSPKPDIRPDSPPPPGKSFVNESFIFLKKILSLSF